MIDEKIHAVWMVFASKFNVLLIEGFKGLHLSLDQGVKGGGMVSNLGGSAITILECFSRARLAC